VTERTLGRSRGKPSSLEGLATLKLVVSSGLILVVIVAVATRLMPSRAGVETATPQQLYFRLHTDDELVAKH
jgi:hypothetical protein